MLPNQMPNQPISFNPVSAAWNTVASYDDYLQAQRAVDRLSDDGFPVEHLDIVGSDLRLVERVTGRLTKGRAAAAGAASGAWTGLLVGLLLGLFINRVNWFGVVLTAIALGAVWGAALGFAAQAATRGARDFSSIKSFVAGRYDIIARDGTVEQARSMLVRAGLLQPAAPVS
jgi:hypothetical protein